MYILYIHKKEILNEFLKVDIIDLNKKGLKK